MTKDAPPGSQLHHLSRELSRLLSQEWRSAAHTKITSACLEVVQSYERKELTQTKALHLVTTQLLCNDFTDTEELRQATLVSYVSMLDKLDKERENPPRVSQEPGAGNGGRRDEKGPPGSSNPRMPEPGGPSHGTRMCSSTPEWDEPAPKRGQVDHTSYAWATAELVILTSLHPDLQQTIRRLHVYTTNIKAAKWDLLSTPGAPEFPNSEWTRILLGEAVDLDRVFSAHYSSRRDEKHIETIGDMELSFKSSLPQKHIATAGDWNLTWNQTIRATTFAFPHRYTELVAYGDYITQLYGALAEPLHARVIEFD